MKARLIATCSLLICSLIANDDPPAVASGTLLARVRTARQRSQSSPPGRDRKGRSLELDKVRALARFHAEPAGAEVESEAAFHRYVKGLDEHARGTLSAGNTPAPMRREAQQAASVEIRRAAAFDEEPGAEQEAEGSGAEEPGAQE